MGILFLQRPNPHLHSRHENFFFKPSCINEWKELARVGAANGSKLMGVEAQ